LSLTLGLDKRGYFSMVSIVVRRYARPLPDFYPPDTLVEVKARKEQCAADGGVDDGEKMSGERRVTQCDAEEHHKNDNQITSPGLKGEDAAFVCHEAEPVDIFQGDF